MRTMGKEVDNKFTWVIKNFSSQQSTKIYSDEFFVDGCKWRLLAFPKGNGVEKLSLYLAVAGGEFLPDGWRRHADIHLSVVNQLSEELSLTREHLFDASTCDWGFASMFSLKKLHDKDGGFLVNGELKIIVEVSVLEVIGKLDVPEECEETTKSLSKVDDNDVPEESEETTEALSKVVENDGAESNDSLKEASSVKESMDVNGFRVLPSQVETVSCIFERHPDIASEFSPKNQHLRSAYMNVLLSLIKTMCQSTQELSKDDLSDADAALAYLTDAGLNLNWLEEKLEEVSEKKENEEAGETRVHEIEEELKELKLKCSNLEAQLGKEKANVSVARAPFSFDDVV
ncbi:MATH domain and coiled-coil domain-containing protein At3g58270 isoform X2 [Arabidopsis lyrata subsp. lyrata]|uniref:MATH domain and coiled-coil domain-containing protein At3g58270 isoform X2 n=1 Tax=Arabidopsis lyrata subsp. lyrata TaxID=81972 RepID=UPI000A29E184|nr:MATH domain and coiled-coil domain-containing protein At3g58270 isoform X2 [Arabidopsis lyrata subsp. lyrata]|eukprot:XP_020880571.1 MATH domain and coiled-coil domain-containing protein At3g58270 isoform X2 [Arabidopsis lyrata subsp. lyrata]